MISRRVQITVSMLVLLTCGSMAWSLGPIPSRAQRLLYERDQLQQELLRADLAASSALLQGEDPVELYARQTGLQEQVDMMQMRLESLAMRLDFDLPVLATGIEQHDPQEVMEHHMAVGRQRAIAAMSHRCETACSAIVRHMNFNSLLDF